jgi:glycosyltransferase involved in cell wall biosynthesis
VTLFASGDSDTRARLVATRERSLRLDEGCVDQLAHHVLLVEQVFQQADQFDIIHFHIGYLHFPLARRRQRPNLTTLHGRLNIPDLVPLYREFREMPVVSISNDQRAPLPWLNWQGTVYHGLPDDLYTVRERPGRYLAFLGRFSPEKGVEQAIEVATRAGMEIKLAAKIETLDQDYYEQVVKPQLEHPLVEYVGEIGDREKEAFLSDAVALLFPIEWPEPFGLVMIEAMACGIPTIAYGRGSVPEVIEDGVTGFIVETLDEAVRAVAQAPALNRRRCRQVFEERFTAARMACDYLDLYGRLADGPATPLAAD